MTASTRSGSAGHSSETRLVRTPSIEVSVRMDGDSAAAAVVFIHGNLSSSVFWKSTMAALAGEFRCVAPDLRGFGDTEPLAISARTGMDDMADDVLAVCDGLGLERPHLVGHSMGGGVAMKMLLRRAGAFASVTLVAPISPFGYGGTRDEGGTPCFPDGAGAGAGSVDAGLVAALAAGERGRDGPRAVMEQLYFKSPFVPDAMEELLDGMLSTRIGDEWYPGNSAPSDNWPGFAPGDAGLVNAMSGCYFDVSGIAEVDPKTPILWLRGADDAIISDASVLDVANQGALGNVPGWPGMDRCPPQPMLRQTRAVLSAYAAHGGEVTERVIADCGHTPFIEKPEEFQRMLKGFLHGNRRSSPD